MRILAIKPVYLIFSEVFSIVVVCDWKIEVNKCMGGCKLTTPGYPGIYPPLADCTYKLFNAEGERVQLHFTSSSTNPRIFNFKKRWASIFFIFTTHSFLEISAVMKFEIEEVFRKAFLVWIYCEHILTYITALSCLISKLAGALLTVESVRFARVRLCG